MPVKEFFKKAIIVTFCVCFVLWLFFPRYEYVDVKARFNKVSGVTEFYSYGRWS